MTPARADAATSADEPDAPATESLPRWLEDPQLRRIVSSDAQVYVRAPGSNAEYRLESTVVPLLVKRIGDSLPEWASVASAVRHIDRERRRCRDCGHEADVA